MLTIKSIVGSNDEVSVVTSVFNPADVKQGTMSSAYETGAARIRYNSNNSQITVDKNTVAFYYDNSTPSDMVTHGVAVYYTRWLMIQQDCFRPLPGQQVHPGLHRAV